LLLFFFAFFLVAMDLFSLFHFAWNCRNDVLLQLVECIESTQNEVKRKMIDREACKAAPKSLHRACVKNFRGASEPRALFSLSFVVSSPVHNQIPLAVEVKQSACAVLPLYRGRILTVRAPSIIMSGSKRDESCGGAHLCRVQTMLSSFRGAARQSENFREASAI
jgi:hypothetical protein